MEIIPTAIPGCFELSPPVHDDHRGRFVKTYHADIFSAHGLNTRWLEEYYTVSQYNVLRGLHFQVPPHDHEKLVYCSEGGVLDVVLDLRKNSQTFGCHAMFELTAEKANMLYIPRGLAHGFYVTGKRAVMHYKVSTVYAPESDRGILWSSASIAWPVANPEISARDADFPELKSFDSPFC